VEKDWQFFIGACILTGALLLPFGHWQSVAVGFLLAIVIKVGVVRNRRQSGGHAGFGPRDRPSPVSQPRAHAD
jgi:uncharacterized membrane protein